MGIHNMMNDFLGSRSQDIPIQPSWNSAVVKGIFINNRRWSGKVRLTFQWFSVPGVGRNTLCFAGRNNELVDRRRIGEPQSARPVSGRQPRKRFDRRPVVHRLAWTHCRNRHRPAAIWPHQRSGAIGSLWREKVCAIDEDAINISNKCLNGLWRFDPIIPAILY